MSSPDLPAVTTIEGFSFRELSPQVAETLDDLHLNSENAQNLRDALTKFDQDNLPYELGVVSDYVKTWGSPEDIQAGYADRGLRLEELLAPLAADAIVDRLRDPWDLVTTVDLLGEAYKSCRFVSESPTDDLDSYRQVTSDALDLLRGDIADDIPVITNLLHTGGPEALHLVASLGPFIRDSTDLFTAANLYLNIESEFKEREVDPTRLPLMVHQIRDVLAASDSLTIGDIYSINVALKESYDIYLLGDLHHTATPQDISRFYHLATSAGRVNVPTDFVMQYFRDLPAADFSREGMAAFGDEVGKDAWVEYCCKLLEKDQPHLQVPDVVALVAPYFREFYTTPDDLLIGVVETASEKIYKSIIALADNYKYDTLVTLQNEVPEIRRTMERIDDEVEVKINAGLPATRTPHSIQQYLYMWDDYRGAELFPKSRVAAIPVIRERLATDAESADCFYRKLDSTYQYEWAGDCLQAAVRNFSVAEKFTKVIKDESEPRPVWIAEPWVAAAEKVAAQTILRGYGFSEGSEVNPSEISRFDDFGLSEEGVRRVINKVLYGDLDDETTPVAAAMDTLATRYAGMISGESGLKTAQKAVGIRSKFLAATQEILDPNNKSRKDVEKRILQSELVSLFGFIATGELDDLYKEYCAREPLPENLGLGSILTVKSNLAYQFLKRLREKNAEVKLAEGPTSPVTIGFEVEYPVGLLQKLYLVKRGRSIVNSVNLFKGLDKQVLEEAFPRHVPITGTLSNTGVYSVHATNATGVYEVDSAPSFSPRTQLRELAVTSVLGGLGDAWGVHETLGGVTLSPEHTEVMDILPIAVAAGLVALGGDRKPGGDLSRPIRERCKKDSYFSPGEWDTDHTKFYFPFHKKRGEYDVTTSYGTTSKPEMVEIRSGLSFKKGQFPELVRTATFSFLAAYGIRATQMAEDVRTTDDEYLAGCWGELMTAWEELLGTHSLTNPDSKDRFIRPNPDYSHYYDEVTPYECFLPKVVETSKTDPTFRETAAKIIRDYSVKVKERIGY